MDLMRMTKKVASKLNGKHPPIPPQSPAEDAPFRLRGCPARPEVNLPAGEMGGIRDEKSCYHKHRRSIPERASKNSID